MKSFVWSDCFGTGIAPVDQQHRRLVELINRFGELVAESTVDARDTRAVLSELADYADYHVREEDTFMVDAGIDPRHLSLHRAEHSQFLQDVAARAERLSLDDLDDAESLLEFLVDWLAYHILVQDQNMARQVRALVDGDSPAGAYERQQLEADGATEPLRVALTGLLHQVSGQNRKLLELNRTLEQRVAERTRELSLANERLETLALTDVLTGLPNRRHGLLRLRALWGEALQSGRGVCCLMVDADDFKSVNDTFGHDAGDVVLRELSRVLRTGVRTDDIVCRLGGDEFLVIAPETRLAGALQLGEQLRGRVAAMRVPVGDGSWHGSVSVGVAAQSAGMAGCEDLVKAADEAVYAAKLGGRDCVRSKGAP